MKLQRNIKFVCRKLFINCYTARNKCAAFYIFTVLIASWYRDFTKP